MSARSVGVVGTGTVASALPFTGFPIWIVAFAGVCLCALGFAVIRIANREEQ